MYHGRRQTSDTWRPALPDEMTNTSPAQPAAAAARSLLVGRGAEMARLQAAWAGALTGERQIVFITGEPGIGKTTLVNAFLDGLAEPGRAAGADGMGSPLIARG